MRIKIKIQNSSRTDFGRVQDMEREIERESERVGFYEIAFHDTAEFNDRSNNYFHLLEESDGRLYVEFIAEEETYRYELNEISED